MRTKRRAPRASGNTRELIARIGAEALHRPAEDRSELLRELNAARGEDWARDLAAKAPPLTGEQRARIAAIILAGPTS